MNQSIYAYTEENLLKYSLQPNQMEMREIVIKLIMDMFDDEYPASTSTEELEFIFCHDVWSCWPIYKFNDDYILLYIDIENLKIDIIAINEKWDFIIGYREGYSTALV